MRTTTLPLHCALAIALAGALATGPAFADRPDWAGDKGGKHEHQEDGHGQREKHRDHDERSFRGDGRDIEVRGHFDDRQRIIVRDYYGGEFRAGHCPPGLAKKHNGCMPPGQARKWEMGRALPPDVAYYPLPPSIVVQIGPPPAGYRYVRVASDILLIAVGTGMVVDAIQDLNGR